MIPTKRQFDLYNSYDVVQARQCARQLAREIGFGLTDQTRIATAVSEVARRALLNQGKGSVTISTVTAGVRRGLECTCLGGKWLADLTAPFPGQILGGVERLVDEFKVEPREGTDVAVVMRKWMR